MNKCYNRLIHLTVSLPIETLQQGDTPNLSVHSTLFLILEIKIKGKIYCVAST